MKKEHEASALLRVAGDHRIYPPVHRADRRDGDSRDDVQCL